MTRTQQSPFGKPSLYLTKNLLLDHIPQNLKRTPANELDHFFAVELSDQAMPSPFQAEALPPTTILLLQSGVTLRLVLRKRMMSRNAPKTYT